MELERLRELIEESRAQIEAMTPAECEALRIAQAESWRRGMTTRCEHGAVDFEQCVECRSSAAEGLLR